jgi:PHP family Zn ribbon phosphoesterase
MGEWNQYHDKLQKRDLSYYVERLGREYNELKPDEIGDNLKYAIQDLLLYMSEMPVCSKCIYRDVERHGEYCLKCKHGACDYFEEDKNEKAN